MMSVLAFLRYFIDSFDYTDRITDIAGECLNERGELVEILCKSLEIFVLHLGSLYIRIHFFSGATWLT